MKVYNAQNSTPSVFFITLKFCKTRVVSQLIGGLGARALNQRGSKTATGKAWTAVQVTRVRERLGLVR